MPKVNALLQQAEQSVISRNFFLAIKLAHQALSEEPDNALAYAIMARIRLLKGEIDAARAHLFTALKSDPENGYVFYLLARAEYMNNDYAGANGWISKALRADAENADYMGFKSIIQSCAFDNIIEARQLSSAGLQKAPDSIICLIASYHIELKAKNDTAASALIMNAVKIHPDDPDLHALLADVLLQRGNKQEAYNSIMTSLRQVPGSENYQARLKEVLTANNFFLAGGKELILSSWFQKLIRILAMLSGTSWIAGLYGILTQQKMILIIVFLMFSVFLLVASIPQMLKQLSEAYLFVFQKSNFHSSGKLFSISVVILLLWFSGTGLLLTSFLDKNEIMTELNFALIPVLFIIVLLLERTLNDYETEKQMKYLIHDWLCVLTCLSFMLVVIMYPKAGFELVFGLLSLAVPLFYGIRQRWTFDEKYDLSKTLTTNEQ